MFSTDQNIETIAQLVESLKRYIGLQGEYVKFDVVEKTVRVLTVGTLTAVFCVLMLLIVVFLSLAGVYALAPHVGMVAALSIAAGVYFLVLLLVFCFRKAWIERPLVRFLASLLLSE